MIELSVPQKYQAVLLFLYLWYLWHTGSPLSQFHSLNATFFSERYMLPASSTSWQLMFQIHSFPHRPCNTLSGTLTFMHIFWLCCLLQPCHNLPLPHLVLASVRTLKPVLCKWCCQVWLPAQDGGCPLGPHLGQCLCAIIKWPLEILCSGCFQSRNPLVTLSVRLFPFKWIWIFFT